MPFCTYRCGRIYYFHIFSGSCWALYWSNGQGPWQWYKKTTFWQGKDKLYKPWPLCKGHGISKKHFNLTFQEEKNCTAITFWQGNGTPSLQVRYTLLSRDRRLFWQGWHFWSFWQRPVGAVAFRHHTVPKKLWQLLSSCHTPTFWKCGNPPVHMPHPPYDIIIFIKDVADPPVSSLNLSHLALPSSLGGNYGAVPN